MRLPQRAFVVRLQGEAAFVTIVEQGAKLAQIVELALTHGGPLDLAVGHMPEVAEVNMKDPLRVEEFVAIWEWLLARSSGVVGIPRHSEILSFHRGQELRRFGAGGDVAAPDVLQRQMETAGAAGGLGDQFKDARIARGIEWTLVGEGEHAQLIGAEDPGALHGAVEEFPMLVKGGASLGGVRRKGNFEKPGGENGQLDLVLVEDRLGLANLVEGLVGIVLAPKVADLGVTEIELAEEADGGEQVFVDFVGGDAEGDLLERGGAGQRCRGGEREQMAARELSHAGIISRGDDILPSIPKHSLESRTIMTRRQILKTVAAAPVAGWAGAASAAGARVLKNMGSAGPGLGARIAATRAAGKQWDIVEYCHEKGLGAAHTSLPQDLDPGELKKLRDQIEKYDMRLTVGLRTARSDDALPQYEAAVKAASEMGGRVACVHDPFSGRRYEQFKTAAEFHKFDAECKAAVQRVEPILRKYKMPLAIENHKGWRSEELVDWVKSTGSEYVGVCLDMVNNVSLIEAPMQTIETLAPYTIFVSFKDIGVDFYEDGLLLSEVPFGEGHLDLLNVVTMMQKKDPRMLFQLEMITRDPLKVPIFTDQYWRVYDEKSPAPARDLAMLIDWVRKHPPKKPLPRTSGLTPEQRLALEDECNQKCIDYARANLPL